MDVPPLHRDALHRTACDAPGRVLVRRDVKFVATDGRVHNGTLTLHSDDPSAPTGP
jgi:hypothetical protein